MPHLTRCCVVVLAMFTVVDTHCYPLYGAGNRDIRRLEADVLIQAGELPGRAKLAGQLLSLDAIRLRALRQPAATLPAANEVLSQQLRELLGDRADNYSVSLLDLSKPDSPTFADVNGHIRRHPGSVGKVLAAAGLFDALAETYPDDIDARVRILTQTRVRANHFIEGDHHKVRLYDRATGTLEQRTLRRGDNANLWEYLDWMLSASSNAAASIVMQQAMALRHAGSAYPMTETALQELFQQPRPYLNSLFAHSFIEPVAEFGLDPTGISQGAFFTRTANALIDTRPSHATTREMVTLMWRIEQGAVVDTFSSLELKRLLYLTERRIRYAAAEPLRGAAVYFKSGSLYACEPEANFDCQQFHGNKLNLMTSVAIIESAPTTSPPLHYLVAISSNVLKRNASLDHQLIGAAIHRLLQRRHAE